MIKNVINSKSSSPFISPLRAVVSPTENRLSISLSSFTLTMLLMALCSKSLYLRMSRPSFVSLLRAAQSVRSYSCLPLHTRAGCCLLYAENRP